MGDPKGFLTTPREERARRPVGERVGDWNEVYQGQSLLPLTVSAQAGRCMGCGVPFCHQGCPLGNLIPEWNDLVSRDDWRAASEWLHATNNFPEFTGQLCPAPCESACVLAINQPAVTIKDVEAAIAEQSWERGHTAPLPPGDRSTGRTVAVIGSGPAGLACAQQLTRAGHTVTVYERDDRVGGLLRYGIPEFKMEKRLLDRRLAQLRAEGTAFRTGVAVGRDVDAAALAARYDAVVIATGASARRELPVPGRRLAGVHQAMEYLPLANRVCEGDLAVSPISAEGRHVVIVGGGDTAADCLGTVLRQRAASVVQLDINPLPGAERAPHQPWPVHPRLYRVSPAHEEARELPPGPGEDVRVFQASTIRFEGDAAGRVRALRLVDVEADDRRPRPGTGREIPADLVLLALGFSGAERGGAGGALAEQLGLRFAAHGGIVRDEHFGAGRDGVFVAGDAGRGQSLIVWAIAEGRSAAAAVDRRLRGGTDLPAPVTPEDGPLAL